MDVITPKPAIFMREYAKRILKGEITVEETLVLAESQGYTREKAIEGLRHWGL